MKNDRNLTCCTGGDSGRSHNTSSIRKAPYTCTPIICSHIRYKWMKKQGRYIGSFHGISGETDLFKIFYHVIRYNFGNVKFFEIKYM